MTWSHNICLQCWDNLHPGREPKRIVAARKECCCYCGAVNRDGIYVRENPLSSELMCRDWHDRAKRQV